MHTLPQEIEVWYVIPAIRREISKCLIKDFGLSYEKIGKILGISKAAVSQYVNNKRASKIKLHEKASGQVMVSCQRLAKKESDAITEIKKILSYIRDKRLPCEVCGKIDEGILKDCKEVYVEGNYRT